MVAIFKNYRKFGIHMRIAPLKMKKKKKGPDLKKIIPIVLTVLMLGSGLIAFTYSPPVQEKIKISVLTWNEFINNYDAVVSNEFDFVEGRTALEVLQMTGVGIQYNNNTIECISSYCNYDLTWKLYVNNNLYSGSPDSYTVNVNDELIFAYQ